MTTRLPSHFGCGHPATPENTTHGTKRKCLTCAKASMLAARAKLPPYVKPTRFKCGHPRDDAHATKEAHPRCKLCHAERWKMAYKKFKCGHTVTPENIVQRGAVRRCRHCTPDRPPVPGKLIQAARPRVWKQYTPPPATPLPRRRFEFKEPARSYALAPQRTARSA